MTSAPDVRQAGPPPGGPTSDPWEGLRTLIRLRILVATLAIPVGVLLRPEATSSAWWVVFWSLLAIGVVSVLFWMGVRIRRGIELQTYLQLGTDLGLITVLTALTGGRTSQSMLLFALVVIAGGLLGRLAGGAFAVLGASLAILTLPWVGARLGAPAEAQMVVVLPPPGMLIAVLARVGVLAGTLGQRVHRAREALEQTSRELDRVRLDNDVILRHLTTGVLTVDGEGVVAYINPAAEQVLGLRAIAVRGQFLTQALPDRLSLLRDVVTESLEKRAPRARAELMMRTAGGSVLPVGVSTNLLTHDERAAGVVAVFQDLTEAREMERRARRNQTLAEVGALAAGIAHELRNGLNPISGSVECLQRELKLEGENAVLMQLIATECNRLNRFVTDLLNYSRERDLAVEAIDLDDHLAEVCDVASLDPRRPASVTVHCQRGDQPGTVRADREQMRQVWLNLATNAFEAMKRGGVLEVRWHQAPHDHITVEFVDQGLGIAADDLPRVGQPFFTTKEGGTGLGIAIAQRIVERHGGTLSFDSIPGRGTTARVTLPAVRSAVLLAA
jgi:two-component system sensor histidine kinase PilS (NtrC family)